MFNLPDSVAYNNKNYKILTPDGYEDFVGVNKITKDCYIHLVFSNGSEIKCSEDHPFLTIDGLIKAKDLNKKTQIETKDGLGCFIVKKRKIKKRIDLYDIVNSGKRHLYYSNDIVSHNCSFLGSTNTLITGEKLATLAYKEPIKKHSDMVIYEDVIKEEYSDDTGELLTKDHTYVICADVSEGKNLDYSAFSVFDISVMPYRQVARYRNNALPPILYPSILKSCAEYYNNAYVLIEVNNNPQVADLLLEDLEYENVLQVASGNKRAQTVVINKGTNVARGVKMTPLVKRIGCSTLKTLIENDKLVINDFETISELTTFVVNGPSFAAEEGCNDDLAMCIHGQSMVYTEDGPMKMKLVVDNKYPGRVWSLDQNGNFVLSKITNYISRYNKNKKWIGIRGNSRNTLMCTTDHRCAYIKDIINPQIDYIEAENMLGKYNVILPGQRFHLTNPLYNRQQLSVLVGTILGDSTLTKHGRLVCGHGTQQKEYCEHKHKILHGKFTYRESFDDRRQKESKTYILEAYTNAQTRYFRDLFYVNGKKGVSNILEYIDEIALAYWYMDDGHKKYSTPKTAGALFCTDSFSIEEHDLLIKLFKDKFNITANLYNANGKPRLYIKTKESYKLWEIIAPYIIPSMHYKIPEEYWGIPKIKINPTCLDFGAELITKIMPRDGIGWESKLYDIEVENTHNFVVNGMVVHNCQVIFSWLTTQKFFKELVEHDLRKMLQYEHFNYVEEEQVPTPIVTTGLEFDHFVEDGAVWIESSSSDPYGKLYKELFNF